MAYKKLYRSSTDKIVGGILGGVGEYFEIDPNLLRILWVLVVVFTGLFPGVVAYIILLFILPKHPDTQVPPAPSVPAN